MERKWVVAAFLDITGFRSWTYRAANSVEMQEEFIDAFYDQLQCYVRQNIGAWSKYQGDGILTAKEFTREERKDGHSVFDFVVELRGLYRKARRVFNEAQYPPPSLRIRIMPGYVFKLMVVDPNDPAHKRLIPEYLGYCTNTLKGLLEVNPEIPCLATEDLGQMMGRHKGTIRGRKLGTPTCYPKGVNREDVDGLEVYKF